LDDVSIASCSFWSADQSRQRLVRCTRPIIMNKLNIIEIPVEVNLAAEAQLSPLAVAGSPHAIVASVIAYGDENPKMLFFWYFEGAIGRRARASLESSSHRDFGIGHRCAGSAVHHPADHIWRRLKMRNRQASGNQ